MEVLHWVWLAMRWRAVGFDYERGGELDALALKAYSNCLAATPVAAPSEATADGHKKNSLNPCIRIFHADVVVGETQTSATARWNKKWMAAVGIALCLPGTDCGTRIKLQPKQEDL